MSKTTTIQGWMYYDTDDFKSLGEYRFFGGKRMDDFSGYIPVCPHTLTFELPAEFDPRPQQIKELEKHRDEMTAKYQAMVTEINSRISKLQAITYESGTKQGEPA